VILALSDPRLPAGDLSLSGYFKSYFFLFQPVSFGRDQPLMGLSTNRFRLNLSYQPQKWINLDAAYDLAPKIQSAALSRNPLLFGQIDPFTYRVADLKTNLYPTGTEAIENFALGQNLDRASITFHTQPADITIGRQPIAWGSARAVNPTDVLAPFRFEALDTEDRIGIDAVRVRIPLGSLSEIDTGYVFGRDFKFENSAFYGRTKFNLHKTDISLLLMGFRENLLAGFDLTRAIRGAGFWLETAYVFVNAFNDEAADTGDYFRASAGLDYSFTHKTYGFIEYHFNGAGSSSPDQYVKGFAKPAYREGSVYLMGRHYIIPGVSYQISPLITLTGESLINTTDPSVYLTPQAEYNVANNVYLGVGAFIRIGKGPAAINDGSSLLRSEFGSYPNYYFGSIRYYF
jgi:hypothetical protein